jgi:large subunit ribosomal protein L14e
MFEIGRVCMKIAGRDAGKRCVVVDIIDKNNVLIDGETRRRKAGISHLEPLPNLLELEKGADNRAVVMAMKKAGIEIAEKKEKSVEKPAEKPKKTRTVKAKKEAKPEAKKPTKAKAK